MSGSTTGVDCNGPADFSYSGSPRKSYGLGIHIGGSNLNPSSARGIEESEN